MYAAIMSCSSVAQTMGDCVSLPKFPRDSKQFGAQESKSPSLIPARVLVFSEPALQTSKWPFL